MKEEEDGANYCDELLSMRADDESSVWYQSRKIIKVTSHWKGRSQALAIQASLSGAQRCCIHMKKGGQTSRKALAGKKPRN